jgi:hypothetical protein
MPTQKQLKTTQKVGGKAPTSSAKAPAKTQGGKAPTSSAKAQAKTQGGKAPTTQAKAPAKTQGGKAPTTQAKAPAKTQGGKAPTTQAKAPAKTQGGKAPTSSAKAIAKTQGGKAPTPAKAPAKTQGGKAPTSSAKAIAKTQGGKAPASQAKAPAKTQGGMADSMQNTETSNNNTFARRLKNMPTINRMNTTVKTITGRFKDNITNSKYLNKDNITNSKYLNKDNITISKYLSKIIWNLGTEKKKLFSEVFMNENTFYIFLRINDDTIRRIINKLKKVNDKRLEFQFFYDILKNGNTYNRIPDVNEFMQKFNNIMLNESMKDIDKFYENNNIFPLIRNEQDNTIQDTIIQNMKYIKNNYKNHENIDSFLNSYIVDWIIRLLINIIFYAIPLYSWRSGIMNIPVKYQQKTINNYIDIYILAATFENSALAATFNNSALAAIFNNSAKSQDSYHLFVDMSLDKKIEILEESLQIYEKMNKESNEQSLKMNKESTEKSF